MPKKYDYIISYYDMNKQIVLDWDKIFLEYIKNT